MNQSLAQLCILNYDFKQVNNTVIADSSGLGQAGVIKNYDLGGTTLSQDIIYGNTASILHLPGGKDGGYIQFPNGVLKTSSAFTLTLFFKPNSCTERQTLFSIGTDSICSVILEPLDETSLYCQGLVTSGGMSQASVTKAVPLKMKEWYHLTLTLADNHHENTLSLYINGILSEQINQRRVSCTQLHNAVNCLLGNGPFCSQKLHADISTITLFSTALSKTQVEELFSVSDSVIQWNISKEITSIEPINVTVSYGCLLDLPLKVSVTFSDETVGYEYVKWPECSNVMTSNEQLETNDYTIAIEGKLKHHPIPVHVTVRYESRTSSQAKLISLHRKGSLAALLTVSLFGHTIFNQNQDRCITYLTELDCDRMLYNFRLTFGQDTLNATPLGGWDEPTGLLRGHSTGHYLSALALAYASTNSFTLKAKLDYIVEELSKLQNLSQGAAHEFKTLCSPGNASQSLWSKDYTSWGTGYLSAYSPDQFVLLELFTPYATIWAPYYTLHKILAGLIDCYQYAGNLESLKVACGISDWVYDRLSHTTTEQRSKMWSMYIAGEYGGMNESLAKLYQLTGQQTYLATSCMFDNPKVFDGLRHNMDTISGIHANQHIPQMIGALEEYEASKQVEYYQIAKHFWNIVVNHYTYSIGGVGRGETFKEPDILANHIDRDRNCETCAMYNMLKLTKDLYSYEPDCACYMDYYERGLMNQIVASQSPVVTPNQHNGVTYMLPIGPGTKRAYSSDYDDFTCCHGTGMENHVKYQEATYFIDEVSSSLYVNLYMSTTLQWTDHKPLLTMEHNFPNEQATIRLEEATSFQLKLRVPYWAINGFQVSLNGTLLTESRKPSSYITLNHDWKKGDLITIHMPYYLRLETTPDLLDNTLVGSICYGPLVMVARSDSTEWLTLRLLSQLSDCFTIEWDVAHNYPILDYYGLKFVPMYIAHNIPYHTYFKIQLLKKKINLP